MADFAIVEAADRVKRMEQCFDVLQEAAKNNPAGFRQDASLQALLRDLTRYYESGLWLQDYELDEKGFFPKTLKRGVLAQDAVFNLLDQIQNADDFSHNCRIGGTSHGKFKNP